MQPIAAYYLMIATDLARESEMRSTRYVSPVPRRTLRDRLTAGLAILVRPSHKAAPTAA